MADLGPIAKMRSGYYPKLPIDTSKVATITGATDKETVLRFMMGTLGGVNTGISPLPIGQDAVKSIFPVVSEIYINSLSLMMIPVNGNIALKTRINFEFINVMNDTRFTSSISGTVRDKDNNFLSNYPVALYYKENKRLISVTMSDINGSFVFNNLKGDSQKYFAVCFDPTSTYDGIVHDRLTPE